MLVVVTLLVVDVYVAVRVVVVVSVTLVKVDDVKVVLVKVEVVELVIVAVEVDVDVVTMVSHVAPSNCAGQLQLNAFGKACASGHNDATQNAASENSRRPMAVTVC